MGGPTGERDDMQFRLLGGLGVEDDDGKPVDLGGPKRRAVLAALLVARGRAVAVDRLQEQVWGDVPPANPETSLQAYVSNLRRGLEPGRRPREAPRLLVTRPSGYALLADRSAVDTARFEDGLERGQALLGGGALVEAREALEGTLDEWGGPPLPELAGRDWVDEHVTWLGELRRQALLARFEVGLALGEHATLVTRLEQAVAEHPFEERMRALLALALYRSGRQREALGALADARRALREEVGVDPGPELRELEAQILAHDPALRLEPTSPPAPAAPPEARPAPVPDTEAVPATAAEPSEARGTGIFVGRQNELDALVAAAGAAETAGRPVVVCGEPGIGKTRLVEELLARLPSSTVVAWGRCSEQATSAGYWPVIQVGRHAGRLCSTGTGAAFGDVHLALAAGHRLLGDREVARLHAEASVQPLDRAGAGPDLVRALLLRAELDPAGAPADRARAAALVEALDLPLLGRRLATLS